MIRETDIAVTFNPSAIQGSRSLGYGQLNISGINISYSVYPSNFGLGFMVSLPSKPSIKNGVQELDQNGKPKYYKEVYIQDINLRNMVDNAVQNAMANKGVFVGNTAQAAQQAGYSVQPAPIANPPGFTPPGLNTGFTPPPAAPQHSTTFAPPPPPPQQYVAPTPVTAQQTSTPVTPVLAHQPLAAHPQAGMSQRCDDDLPF